MVWIRILPPRNFIQILPPQRLDLKEKRWIWKDDGVVYIVFFFIEIFQLIRMRISTKKIANLENDPDPTVFESIYQNLDS